MFGLKLNNPLKYVFVNTCLMTPVNHFIDLRQYRFITNLLDKVLGFCKYKTHLGFIHSGQVRVPSFIFQKNHWEAMIRENKKGRDQHGLLSLIN